MYRHFFKRLIDIICSFFGILFLGFPMLVIALIIMIEDPGPAFFTQKRVGLHKK
ncbi:MAG: sugar transferase, partial [Lachnospiraceae bacterium]|nr:sugar transferase [Lachnospiraceae bacterium]